jgi:pyridoxal phosphate enzyme (YggS family)
VSTLLERLADVRARIAGAAGRAGREPSTVRLIAVSKTFSADRVREAAAAGQLDFGENKVQEALRKMEATLDLPLRWHLVGHLQSNKAKRAAERFDVIHSIDSPELLRRVDEAARAAGRRVDLLVQVDLAGESTKFGAEEPELPAIFEAAAEATHARTVGLMLLPPAFEDAELARPYFRALSDVRNRLISFGVPPAMLTELSIGMSHDFEVAIEEGATMIRVGSAIFGARPAPGGQPPSPL